MTLDAHVVKRRATITIDARVQTRAPGEAVGIFGASAAGKSTLLSCIAGLEALDGGAVTFGGRPLDGRRPLHERGVGYLTQSADLFPHLTVERNVRFGAHRSPRNDAWLAELRMRLGLDEIASALPHRISGGQARRVALARMLARKPPLVLLDEPFTGLDRATVRELVDDVRLWQGRLGFTLVVVDHQADVLERLARRVIVLERGRVVQDDVWDAVRTHPATAQTAALLAPL